MVRASIAWARVVKCIDTADMHGLRFVRVGWNDKHKISLAVLLRGQLVQIAGVPLRVSIWQQCKRGEEVVPAVGETLRQCDSKALFISGARW